MKIHQSLFMPAAALLLLLVSCVDTVIPEREIEYIPFQESKDGNWGMISPSGEVLFSEEFQNEPTVAINGRFMVKNADGLWEIYTTDKKPKKIGGEYLYASLFYEDVAPVVAKGQRIQFIDRDGNVKTTLDKIGGKAVSKCKSFVAGRAMVLVDGKWGAVDTDGKVVIEPKYTLMLSSTEGYFLAVDQKYENESDYEKITYTILNSNGKVVADIKGSKFKETQSMRTSYRFEDYIIDEALYVSADINGDRQAGLLGFNGEWLLKPSSRVKSFSQKTGQNMVFYDGEGYGLMDISGEEKIRPKYEFMFLLDEDVFAAKSKSDETFSLYNLEGEKIGKDEYLQISHFYDGKHCFARVGKNDVVLINKNGEEQKLKTNICAIDFTFDDNTLESDYYDMDEVVSAMKISPTGFMGLDTKCTGPMVIEKLNSTNTLTKSLSGEAREYSNSTSIYAICQLTNKGEITVEVQNYGLVSQERTGSGWFSYYKSVWTDKPVKSMILTFYITGNEQLQGKMREMYAKMLEAVKKTGKTVKEGKNSAVIETSPGLYYYISWGGKRVDLFYGYYDLNSCDTNAFDDATEEDYSDRVFPSLSSDKNATPQQPASTEQDEEYGELGSPPADDL
ncbi:MAG: WG repeat-containing protein [Prevotella sp.]|nr:WG repeat-containing protein [Prevotella sp.]